MVLFNWLLLRNANQISQVRHSHAQGGSHPTVRDAQGFGVVYSIGEIRLIDRRLDTLQSILEWTWMNLLLAEIFLSHDPLEIVSRVWCGRFQGTPENTTFILPTFSMWWLVKHSVKVVVGCSSVALTARLWTQWCCQAWRHHDGSFPQAITGWDSFGVINTVGQ